jgi:hypothetical protein
VTPTAKPPGAGPTIALDRPSALPGGTIGLTGQGCPADTDVVLTVQGHPAGGARTDADGTFTADLTLPDLPVGAYAVDVRCGPRRASVPIDLVVASSGPIAGSLAATAGSILVFFVLLGGMLLYRDQGQRRRPALDGDVADDLDDT